MSFEKEFEHSQHLFDSALEEFITKGYENASINIILENAGMSKGQFYYHFENKEGLYFALIDIMVTRKQEFLAKMMKPEDFEQDIFSIFKTLLKYGLAFARAYPMINQFSESFIREKGSPIYQTAIKLYSFEENDAITSLVDRAYHNNEFEDEFPLEFIRSIIGYLFNNVVELLDFTNIDQAEDQMNHLIDFMKTGLASKP
jgi:AcrR family transcriptional regulator